MSTIPDSVREFVAGGLWAHVVTMNRQGEPHVNLCWAGFDGDEIVFASFFDAKRAARLRRDPRVTLSFQAKEYDGGALFPYLVVNGRASVEEGGALAVMDHLALGTGCPDPPAPPPPIRGVPRWSDRSDPPWTGARRRPRRDRPQQLRSDQQRSAIRPGDR
jgi:hypothetical protein